MQWMGEHPDFLIILHQPLCELTPESQAPFLTILVFKSDFVFLLHCAASLIRDWTQALSSGSLAS